jgi:hypothetical protein
MNVSASITCPHCGESWETSIDTSQGDYQTVDDCYVCCRPMTVHVECEPGEVISIQTETA